MRKPVYKVVNKDRSSFNFDKFDNNRFKKFYIKNEIVTGEKDSLGIFCFRRKMDLMNFIKWLKFDDIKDLLILKVEPIGKGITPKIISVNMTEHLLRIFYYYNNKKEIYQSLNRTSAPKGTICYPSVKVLD